MAGPHGRPQDRRVGRPARRGVGGGPARPGHRPAGHGHRVPRAARPGRGRVAAAHRADRAGPRRRPRRGRGQPGGRARQAVVLPRPGHADRCASTRSARSASASCSPASSGCASCWPPRGCSTPARKRRPPFLPRLHRAGHGPGARRPSTTSSPTRQARWPAVRFRIENTADAGRAGRAADRRRAGRAGPRPGRRRDRARPRRRQRRGPAAVLRRDAVPGGRRVPHAGRLRDRARAGHPAGRPRRRRALLHADRGGHGGWCPTSPRRPRGSRGCATGPAARWAAGWTASSALLAALRAARCSADPLRAIDAHAERGAPAARRPARARVLRGLDRRAVDLEHLRARLTALGPAATLARGYAIVQRVVTDDPVLPVLRSVGEVGAGRPAARARRRRGGRPLRWTVSDWRPRPRDAVDRRRPGLRAGPRRARRGRPEAGGGRPVARRRRGAVGARRGAGPTVRGAAGRGPRARPEGARRGRRDPREPTWR